MIRQVAALALGFGLCVTAVTAADPPAALPPVAPPPALPPVAPPVPTRVEAAPAAPEGGSGLSFLAAPAEEKNRLGASWENGLWFESADKQFRVHVGGNAQIDSTWLIGPVGNFAIPGGGQNGI